MRRFGTEEVLEDVVTSKRLRWMAHVARMDDSCLPKRFLFGWLPQPIPAHGTKQRWREKVRKDLKVFDRDEKRWFHEAQDRKCWRSACKVGLDKITEERQRRRVDEPHARGPLVPHTSALVCATCSRVFRRRQDIARHKCVKTRPHRHA